MVSRFWEGWGAVISLIDIDQQVCLVGLTLTPVLAPSRRGDDENKWPYLIHGYGLLDKASL